MKDGKYEVFIDSTADGDVCVDAGCEFHLGEDPKSLYDEPSAPPLLPCARTASV